MWPIGPSGGGHESLEQLSPTDTGERLRIAREAANVTQAAAATAIGVARTTMIAIEQGERRVRIDELQKLAKVFGHRSMRFCVVRPSMSTSRRASTQGRWHHDEPSTMRRTCWRASRAEVELENLLGVQRVATTRLSGHS